MPNENCLEGMRCPKCDSEEPFYIVVTKTVRMWDDGSDNFVNPEECGSDEEWDEDSSCSCSNPCDYMGKVRDFQFKLGCCKNLSPMQRNAIESSGQEKVVCCE